MQDHRRTDPPTGRAVRVARVMLIGVGAAGVVFGGWLFLFPLRPSAIVGLVIWFAVAVLLHDAILSPVLFGAGWVLRRGAGRVPLAVLAVVQVAAVVGGIGSLLLLPAIHAKQLGVRNPTVLPFDYGAHLAGLGIAVAIAAVFGVAVVLVVQRRRGRVTS